MQNITENIANYITENNLFNKKEKLLLGVSGGPDSVFLVHALKELGYADFSIAHVNHQLRGVSAQKDAEFVKELAENFKVLFFEIKVPTTDYAKENKLSIEDAARIIRLDFYKQILAKVHFDRVVLAHNANDQVETILMRFLRGSGLQGLIGIESLKIINKLTVARPLLTTWRKDILKYLDHKKIRYCQDISNKKPIYLRNKLRLKLIPILEKYNPNFGKTMIRMAKVLLEEHNYLNGQTQKLLEEVIQINTPSAIKFNRKKLFSLPIAMQRRVVRAGIEFVQGHLDGVSSLYIENFINNKLTVIKLDNKGILSTGKKW